MIPLPSWIQSALPHISNPVLPWLLTIAAQLGPVPAKLPIRLININHHTHGKGVWNLSFLLANRDPWVLTVLWWYVLEGLQLPSRHNSALNWNWASGAYTDNKGKGWDTLETGTMNELFHLNGLDTLESLPAFKIFTKLREIVVASQQQEAWPIGDIILLGVLVKLLLPTATDEKFVRESSKAGIYHRLVLRDHSVIHIRDAREEEGKFRHLVQLGWVFNLSGEATKKLQEVIDWGLRMELAHRLANPPKNRPRK